MDGSLTDYVNEHGWDAVPWRIAERLAAAGSPVVSGPRSHRVWPFGPLMAPDLESRIDNPSFDAEGGAAGSPVVDGMDQDAEETQ